MKVLNLRCKALQKKGSQLNTMRILKLGIGPYDSEF